MVKVNGEFKDTAGKTVKELLIDSGYNLGRVAVEVNGDILPKSKYDEYVLRSGDSVEVVGFVGGG